MRRSGNYCSRIFNCGHQYPAHMTLHLSALGTNNIQDVSFIFYSMILPENTKPISATSCLYQKNVFADSFVYIPFLKKQTSFI